VGVKDTSSDFLKYLDKQGTLGSQIEIMEKESFDSSFRIRVGRNNHFK
jgi:DtxR family Mn-dependent transcriptional regulator